MELLKLLKENNSAIIKVVSDEVNSQSFSTIFLTTTLCQDKEILQLPVLDSRNTIN